MLSYRPEHRKWLFFLTTVIVLAAYWISYIALSTLETGLDWEQLPAGSRQFRFHSRSYDFDPWIYQPIADLEAWMRGPRVQVVIEDGRMHPGPMYGFGPYGMARSP